MSDKLLSRYGFQSIQLGGVAELIQRYIFFVFARMNLGETLGRIFQSLRAQCGDVTATRCSALF